MKEMNRLSVNGQLYRITDERAVRFEQQSLSAEEKALARENIGAAQAGDEKIFIATFDVTQKAALDAALEAGKVLFCKKANYFYTLYNRNSSGDYYFRNITSNGVVQTMVCRHTGAWESLIMADSLQAVDLEARITALETVVKELTPNRELTEEMGA